MHGAGVRKRQLFGLALVDRIERPDEVLLEFVGMTSTVEERFELFEPNSSC